MAEWVRVACVADCPPDHSIEVVAEGKVIALFHVDGQFYALDGICPHQGGPLGKGTISGCVITCPWHGWQFDVTNGIHQINENIAQPSYTVRLEEGSIFVRFGEE